MRTAIINFTEKQILDITDWYSINKRIDDIYSDYNVIIIDRFTEEVMFATYLKDINQDNYEVLTADEYLS